MDKNAVISRIRDIVSYHYNSWKNKYLKYTALSYAKRHNLYDKACQEIASYTKEDIDTVRQKQKGWAGLKGKTRIFDEQKNLTSAKIEDFYKGYEYYLYELPLWNAEQGRSYYLWSILEPHIISNGYKHILDYGGGSGDLAIELVSRGLEVDYLDINEILYDFVAYRMKARNIKFGLFKRIEDTKKMYDCIVSFDVFEHLKGLPQYLSKISEAVKKDGGLVFSGAFSGGSLHLLENEIYSNFQKLDRLIASCGFVYSHKFAQYYFYKKIYG